MVFISIPNITTLHSLHSLKLSVKYHKTHIPIHHLHQIYLSQSHLLRPQNDVILLAHAMSRSRPKSRTSTIAPCLCRTLLTDLFVTPLWGFLVLFGFGKLWDFFVTRFGQNYYYYYYYYFPVFVVVFLSLCDLDL
jgi:hypothetical protein